MNHWFSKNIFYGDANKQALWNHSRAAAVGKSFHWIKFDYVQIYKPFSKNSILFSQLNSSQEAVLINTTRILI